MHQPTPRHQKLFWKQTGKIMPHGRGKWATQISQGTTTTTKISSSLFLGLPSPSGKKGVGRGGGRRGWGGVTAGIDWYRYITSWYKKPKISFIVESTKSQTLDKAFKTKLKIGLMFMVLFSTVSMSSDENLCVDRQEIENQQTTNLTCKQSFYGWNPSSLYDTHEPWPLFHRHAVQDNPGSISQSRFRCRVLLKSLASVLERFQFQRFLLLLRCKLQHVSSHSVTFSSTVFKWSWRHHVLRTKRLHSFVPPSCCY